MNTERYALTCHECGETGIIGLTLNDTPMSNFADGDLFVMSDGIGIAHDVTEHVNGVREIGTVHDEFQALGAIWYTRGQFNDLRRDDIGSGLSVYQHLASDISRMFCIASYDGLHGREDDQPEDDHEDTWQEIISQAREDILSESDSNGDLEDLDLGWLDDYLNQALQGLRLGIAKQTARYPDACVANTRFWDIVESMNDSGDVDFPTDECDAGRQYELIIDGHDITFAELYAEDY